jgi:hypothetical protein
MKSSVWILIFAMWRSFTSVVSRVSKAPVQRAEAGKYQVWIAPQSGEGTPDLYDRP